MFFFTEGIKIYLKDGNITLDVAPTCHVSHVKTLIQKVSEAFVPPFKLFLYKNQTLVELKDSQTLDSYNIRNKDFLEKGEYNC